MKCRVGDLIKYDFGNNFGKILDIIDIDNNSFYEYDIITGRGSLNSKVTVKIKPLVNANNLKVLDERDRNLDPHDFRLVDIDYEKQKLNENKEYIIKAIKFLDINENREDKLNRILSKND